MFVEVTKTCEIAPGGMKGFTVEGTEIVICNEGGQFYALSKRCGHMRGRLDKGTLVGYILTCPWHYSQFDIHDGRALSGPVLCRAEGDRSGPKCLLRRMGRQVSRKVTTHIKTGNLKTFKVKVDGDTVKVEI